MAYKIQHVGHPQNAENNLLGSRDIYTKFVMEMTHFAVLKTDNEISLKIQPCKYQLSNSQVSDISKSVVKDKKLTVHNSHPGAI